MNVWKRIESTKAFEYAFLMTRAVNERLSFSGDVSWDLTPQQFVNGQRRRPRKLPRCTGRLNLGWTLPYYRAVIKGEIDDIPF